MEFARGRRSSKTPVSSWGCLWPGHRNRLASTDLCWRRWGSPRRSRRCTWPSSRKAGGWTNLAAGRKSLATL